MIEKMTVRYVRSEPGAIADSWKMGNLDIPPSLMKHLRQAMSLSEGDVQVVYSGLLRAVGSDMLTRDYTREEVYEFLSKAFYGLVCIKQEESIREFAEWMQTPAYEGGAREEE